VDEQNMGVLDQIAGLIVARPYGYRPEEMETLDAVIRHRLSGYRIPVLAGVDVGHITPLQTLPIGCEALPDADLGRFAMV